jgi:acetyl esterase/lipase
MPLKKIIPLLLIGIILSSCTSVATLNLIVRNDPGAIRSAQDVPFGDNQRQKLDVYVPKTGAENAPVILFVYGGSWANGDKKNYSFVGNNLAAMGYVAVLPNYRLVPEVVYPDFINDVASALKWTEDNIADYGGDPKTIFMAGHSAGAYNVMMVALDEQYASKAGADRTAVKGVIGLSGPYDFFPFDFQVAKNAFSISEQPGNDPEATQPINHVDASDPPLLLISGLADATVYPSNTRALTKLGKKAGMNITTIYYDDLGHPDTLMAMGSPFKHKAPVLQEMQKFIEANRSAETQNRLATLD